MTEICRPRPVFGPRRLLASPRAACSTTNWQPPTWAQAAVCTCDRFLEPCTVPASWMVRSGLYYHHNSTRVPLAYFNSGGQTLYSQRHNSLPSERQAASRGIPRWVPGALDHSSGCRLTVEPKGVNAQGVASSTLLHKLVSLCVRATLFQQKCHSCRNLPRHACDGLCFCSSIQCARCCGLRPGRET